MEAGGCTGMGGLTDGEPCGGRADGDEEPSEEAEPIGGAGRFSGRSGRAGGTVVDCAVMDPGGIVNR